MIIPLALLSVLSFTFFDSVNAATVPKGFDGSSIIFWYFSKKNPTNGVPVSANTVSVLRGTSFDVRRDTMFIVHGWHSTNQSDFVNTVRNAITTNLDVNLFLVDWSKFASENYISATTEVTGIGSYVANFITSLVSVYKLSLARTTLVGHSLGGQIVGAIGAGLNGKAAIIVGLDPALPLFGSSGPKDRLDPSDAQFVHVIHTNGGLKAFSAPVGHADYFPNGGQRQPGCGIDIVGSCAHARAYKYYAESLAGGSFVGVSCGSYKDFSSGKCNSRKTSLMGRLQIDKRASGLYYLYTNAKSPFARG